MLHNHKTNWDVFKDNLDCMISLDIEDPVLNLTQHIQRAAWSATPLITAHLSNGKMPSKRNLQKKGG